MFIQQGLRCLGYSFKKYGCDGKFGEETKKAVSNFQSDNGLKPTGEIDITTYELIRSKIMEIQSALNDKNYRLGSYGVDGKCGKCTINAIKRFQRNNGLSDDGIVGPKTKEVLFKSSTSIQSNPGLFYSFIIKVFNSLGYTDEYYFKKRCAEIINSLFRVDINFEYFNHNYFFKKGNLKITVNAKFGSCLTTGGNKYIIRNKTCISVNKGYKVEIIDRVYEEIKKMFEVKHIFKYFENRIGEAVVNGTVSWTYSLLDPKKIIYEIGVKLDKNSNNISGTLEITIECDNDIKEKAKCKAKSFFAAIEKAANIDPMKEIQIFFSQKKDLPFNNENVKKEIGKFFICTVGFGIMVAGICYGIDITGSLELALNNLLY